MAGPVQNVQGTGQGPQDAAKLGQQAYRQLLKDIGFAELEINKGPRSGLAIAEIRKELTAQGADLSPAAIKKAKARIETALLEDAIGGLGLDKVPSDLALSHNPKLVPVIEKGGKFQLAPQLRVAADGKEHAVAHALKKLGYDLDNLTAGQADAVEMLMRKGDFQLTSPKDWATFVSIASKESTKLSAAGVLGAKSSSKTQATDLPKEENRPQVDASKVGTETGKGVRGNWLNSLAANMASKPGGKGTPDAFNTAAKDLLAEMGVENATPQQQKQVEDLLRNIMKGAVVDGELQPGKAMANAWMQLAEATGDRRYVEFAARAQTLQNELNKLGPDEGAASVNPLMASMVPGIAAAAVGAKTKIDIADPSPEMFSVISQVLGIMNVDTSKIDANAVLGLSGASGVQGTQGVQRTEADRLHRRNESLLNLLERGADSNAPALLPHIQNARAAFEQGDYAGAQQHIKEAATVLLNKENPCSYEMNGVNLTQGRMGQALLMSAEGLRDLAIAKSAEATGTGKVTPEVRAQAKKAFDEIAAEMPGLKASSPEGKAIMAAFENIFARGAKNDLEVINHAMGYLSEKMGMDMSGRAQLYAQPAAQFGHMPGAAQQLRNMALKDVAHATIDPQGFAAQANQMAGCLPAGSGSPIAGPGGWMGNVQGQQRSAIGFAILNDPSLSFEDKLFLFMMYMAMFAEEDEKRKMEEIAELDRKEELKTARQAKINQDLPLRAAARKNADADAQRLQGELQRMKDKGGADPKAIEDLSKRADAAKAAADRARAGEEALKTENVSLKQESPPKSRDMLNMELRRLEQWRGMLMDMVKQILEERNRRIRQIWQG